MSEGVVTAFPLARHGDADATFDAEEQDFWTGYRTRFSERGGIVLVSRDAFDAGALTAEILKSESDEE